MMAINLPENAPFCLSDESYLQVLLAAIVEQDQTAFAALYEHFADRVYGLVFTLLRQAELAEEITEDVFWQIWRQAPRFDPTRGSVVSWVLTIARSRALDALRKPNSFEEQSECAEPTGNADNPVDLLLAVEAGSRLHTALAGLEPVPRQLVTLAFLRGLSHDEIARHTGLPLGTVKSHIRRALLALKRSLGTD